MSRPLFRTGAQFVAIALVLAGVIAGCTADHIVERTVDFETGEGTQLAFDVSPDGKTIVFDLLGQLWTVPVEGGSAIPLTDAVADSSEDLDPIYSPDGQTVAFRADRPGGAGLFSLSLGDKSIRRLTEEVVGAASWSPDGQRLAIVQGQSIRLLGSDGGEAEEIKLDSLPTPFAIHPSWSPDGDRLVFVNASDQSRSGGRLWEVSSSGGIARPLGDLGQRAKAPVFDPQGQRVAFFSPDSASRFQLWIMEPKADPTQLTSHQDVTPLRARWIADGSRLVYHADGKLWSIPAEGGTPSLIPFTARVELVRNTLRQPPVRFTPPNTVVESRGHMGLALAPGGSRVAMIALGQLWDLQVGQPPRAVAAMPPTAGGLSWAPDEHAVVWSAGPGGDEDLYATDLLSGQTRQITALSGSEAAPSWSPDGQQISFVHWYDGSELQLTVIPAEGPVVEATGMTTELGQVFMPWGFLGARQGAPMWSPDGQPLIVYASNDSVVIVSLDGSRQEIPFAKDDSTQNDQRSSSNPSFLTWYAEQHVVYIENGLLWRASFDSDSTGIGEASQISNDAALYASTSRDGSVLYLSPDGLKIHRPDGQVESLGWPLTYNTPDPAGLLIKNVRVMAVTGSTSDGPVDILTTGGRIVQIGPAGTLDAGGEIRIIDAEGRTAIPGLIDLHTHLWDDAVLPAALYFGVTTVRDMGSNSVARLAAYRDAIEAGLSQGPRIILGGVQFWGTGSFSGSGAYEVSDDASRTRATNLMAAFRSHYLKTRLFSDWSDAARLVEAAHRKGFPVSGHVAAPFPLVAAGMDGMEHLGPSGFRTNEIVYDDFIQLFRHANMWIVPTAVGYSSVSWASKDSTMLDEPETASFVTPFLKWWAFRLPSSYGPGYERFADFTRVSALKFHQGGVMIGAGSDTPVIPWALHGEMEELVTAGFTPLEAITSATKIAADVLGASDEIGTIEEGKWADLVLLNADPLDDIGKTRDIWMVIKGGVEVDRSALRSWVARSSSVPERN